MKRNLILLSLVVGMGVQAVDWYAMRSAAAAGRQVQSPNTTPGWFGGVDPPTGGPVPK